MCYNNRPGRSDPARLAPAHIHRGILLLGFILLACQVSAAPRSWPAFESGNLLFQDDFSDPRSGWRVSTDASSGRMEYQDQAYRILVEGEQQLLWSGPGLDFVDSRLEVDVFHPGEARDDDFGLVCRAQDDRNFYYLVISSDGYFGIGKVVDGAYTLISAEAMPPSEAILRGSASNHLRADCEGDQLTLYANGIQLDSVYDDEFERGEVGLLAGTLDAAETEVVFDNFSVLVP
jgi:hypothetical protein